MRILTVLSLATALTLPALPGLAMDSMESGSMSHPMGGPMAKCAASDPAVIVNTTKMTYMMDTHANRSAMSGMMDHDKFVCKSTADHMGAKMTHAMTGSMMHADSMHSDAMHAATTPGHM
jgi:hypothetical protein